EAAAREVAVRELLEADEHLERHAGQLVPAGLLDLEAGDRRHHIDQRAGRDDAAEREGLRLMGGEEVALLRRGAPDAGLGRLPGAEAIVRIADPASYDLLPREPPGGVDRERAPIVGRPGASLDSLDAERD